MIVITLVVVAALILVVVGLVAPRVSKRLQGKVDRGADRTRAEVDRHTGDDSIVEKAADGSVSTTQKASDKASEAGREGHSKLER